MPQREQRRREQDQGEAGVALHPLAGIEDEAAALDQIAREAQRDEGVVDQVAPAPERGPEKGAEGEQQQDPPVRARRRSSDCSCWLLPSHGPRKLASLLAAGGRWGDRRRFSRWGMLRRVLGARADPASGAGARARGRPVPDQYLHVERTGSAQRCGRCRRGLRRDVDEQRVVRDGQRICQCEHPGPALQQRRIGPGLAVPGQQLYDGGSVFWRGGNGARWRLRGGVGEFPFFGHGPARIQHPGSTLCVGRVSAGRSVPGQHLYDEPPGLSRRGGGGRRRFRRGVDEQRLVWDGHELPEHPGPALCSGRVAAGDRTSRSMAIRRTSSLLPR